MSSSAPPRPLSFPPLPVARNAIARAARATVAWSILASAVLGALGALADSALVRLRGSADSPWLAAGLAAGAVGTLLGLLLAPAFALVHWTARALAARPRLSALSHLPVALVAVAAGARLARTQVDPSQPPRHPVALVAGLAGFALALFLLSRLWSRAATRWARAAALLIAALAFAFDVAGPRSVYRDVHDLASVIAVAGVIVVTRPAFEVLVRARAARLFVIFAALFTFALAVVVWVDPVRPGWRAAALRSGHYLPRTARAFRLLVDLDGDGFSSVAWGGDCADLDRSRHPLAKERTPGLDMNCNGIPLPAHPTDADRGLAPPEGDPDLPPGAVDRLLLLTIDCFRVDALRPALTPNLLSLAARGIRFTRAYAGGSQTQISLPLVQRGWDGGVPAAARLSRRGVTSTAILSFQMANVPAMARGFDTLQGAAPGGRWTAAEVTERALADLRAHPGPHYLWAHYYDAHAPYPIDTSEGPRRSAAHRAYQDQVTILDREIGRLLAAVEAGDPGLRRTVVVVTADHGEALGEHGVDFHGFTTWESIVHVPAILVAPGVTPGTYDGLVTHRDLASTALGVFGAVAVESDAELFGRSWLRLRAAPRPALHRFVVTRSDRVLTLLRGAAIPQAAIVEGSLKLTKTFEDGLREMYDLSADPGEERDVEPMRATEAGRLERHLELYRDLDGYP